MDSGHDVIIAVDSQVSEELRGVVADLGVDIEPRGTAAVDHINIVQSADAAVDHTLLASNEYGAIDGLFKTQPPEVFCSSHVLSVAVLCLSSLSSSVLL